MTNELKFGPGKVIFFSEGEYSDYGYCGRVVTLRDLDLRAVADEFRRQYKATDEYDTPDPDSFVAWLCANQYVVEIDSNEVHLGSYGRLEF